MYAEKLSEKASLLLELIKGQLEDASDDDEHWFAEARQYYDNTLELIRAEAEDHARFKTLLK